MTHDCLSDTRVLLMYLVLANRDEIQQIRETGLPVTNDCVRPHATLWRSSH